MASIYKEQNKYLDEDPINRLDPTVLAYLRLKKKLTKADMARLLGVSFYRYFRYETPSAKADVAKVQLSIMRKIFKILEPDPLEVCDLIRYFPIEQETVKLFRRACKKMGLTPLEALVNFMRMMIKESDVTHRKYA